MATFSERQGITPPKRLQTESMDEDLRNSLWNALTGCYWQRVQLTSDLSLHGDIHNMVHRLWLDYFRRPVDTLESKWGPAFFEIRQYFFSCSWNEIYDFIEFVCANFPDVESNSQFSHVCNRFLEREASGYRFVGGQIAPIISKEEVAEVEQSLALTDRLQPVSEHMAKALSLLSDREAPDYRNSIKESISAVEAVCRIVSGDTQATVSKALAKIEAKAPLHGALKSALKSLYGYASHEDGIRHSLRKASDVSDVAFEEAKFMLVSCSAFVNYLVAKSQKAGISL